MHAIENDAELIPLLEVRCISCDGARRIDGIKCKKCEGSGVCTTKAGEQVLALVRNNLRRLMKEIYED